MNKRREIGPEAADAAEGVVEGPDAFRATEGVEAIIMRCSAMAGDAVEARTRRSTIASWTQSWTRSWTLNEVNTQRKLEARTRG